MSYHNPNYYRKSVQKSYLANHANDIPTKHHGDYDLIPPSMDVTSSKSSRSSNVSFSSSHQPAFGHQSGSPKSSYDDISSYDYDTHTTEEPINNKPKRVEQYIWVFGTMPETLGCLNYSMPLMNGLILPGTSSANIALTHKHKNMYATAVPPQPAGIGASGASGATSSLPHTSSQKSSGMSDIRPGVNTAQQQALQQIKRPQLPILPTMHLQAASQGIPESIYIPIHTVDSTEAASPEGAGAGGTSSAQSGKEDTSHPSTNAILTTSNSDRNSGHELWNPHDTHGQGQGQAQGNTQHHQHQLMTQSMTRSSSRVSSGAYGSDDGGIARVDSYLTAHSSEHSSYQNQPHLYDEQPQILLPPALDGGIPEVSTDAVHPRVASALMATSANVLASALTTGEPLLPTPPVPSSTSEVHSLQAMLSFLVDVSTNYTKLFEQHQHQQQLLQQQAAAESAQFQRSPSTGSANRSGLDSDTIPADELSRSIWEDGGIDTDYTSSLALERSPSTGSISSRVSGSSHRGLPLTLSSSSTSATGGYSSETGESHHAGSGSEPLIMSTLNPEILRQVLAGLQIDKPFFPHIKTLRQIYLIIDHLRTNMLENPTFLEQCNEHEDPSYNAYLRPIYIRYHSLLHNICLLCLSLSSKCNCRYDGCGHCSPLANSAYIEELSRSGAQIISRSPRLTQQPSSSSVKSRGSTTSGVGSEQTIANYSFHDGGKYQHNHLCYCTHITVTSDGEILPIQTTHQPIRGSGGDSGHDAATPSLLTGRLTFTLPHQLSMVHTIPTLVDKFDISLRALVATNNGITAVARNGQLFSWGKGAAVMGDENLQSLQSPQSSGLLHQHYGSDSTDPRSHDNHHHHHNQTSATSAMSSSSTSGLFKRVLIDKPITHVSATKQYQIATSADGEVYIWDFTNDVSLRPLNCQLTKQDQERISGAKNGNNSRSSVNLTTIDKASQSVQQTVLTSPGAVTSTSNVTDSNSSTSSLTSTHAQRVAFEDGKTQDTTTKTTTTTTMTTVTTSEIITTTTDNVSGGVKAIPAEDDIPLPSSLSPNTKPDVLAISPTFDGDGLLYCPFSYSDKGDKELTTSQSSETETAGGLTLKPISDDGNPDTTYPEELIIDTLDSSDVVDIPTRPRTRESIALGDGTTSSLELHHDVVDRERTSSKSDGHHDPQRFPPSPSPSASTPNESIALSREPSVLRHTENESQLSDTNHELTPSISPSDVQYIQQQFKHRSTLRGLPTSVIQQSKMTQMVANTATNVRISHRKATNQPTPLSSMVSALPSHGRHYATFPQVVKAVSGEKVLSATLGRAFGCIVTSTGRVLSFGSTSHGRNALAEYNFARASSLENPMASFAMDPVISYLHPQYVSSLLHLKVISVACGWNHSLFLTETGDVFAVGCGLSGKTGLGLPFDVGMPQQINFHAHNNPSSFQRAPTLRLEGGTPSNLASPPHNTPTSPTPASSASPDESELNALTANGVTPITHSALLRYPSPTIPIISISCGHGHSMCLDAMGQLFTFGNNSFGQLGHGDCTNRLFPVKVNFSRSGLYQQKALTNANRPSSPQDRHSASSSETTDALDEDANVHIISISAGAFHSAAVSTAGELYVWGSNRYQQLGIGLHSPLTCRHYQQSQKRCPACVRQEQQDYIALHNQQFPHSNPSLKERATSHDDASDNRHNHNHNNTTSPAHNTTNTSPSGRSNAAPVYLDPFRSNMLANISYEIVTRPTRVVTLSGVEVISVSCSARYTAILSNQRYHVNYSHFDSSDDNIIQLRQLNNQLLSSQLSTEELLGFASSKDPKDKSSSSPPAGIDAIAKHYQQQQSSHGCQTLPAVPLNASHLQRKQYFDQQFNYIKSQHHWVQHNQALYMKYYQELLSSIQDHFTAFFTGSNKVTKEFTARMLQRRHQQSIIYPNDTQSPSLGTRRIAAPSLQAGKALPSTVSSPIHTTHHIPSSGMHLPMAGYSSSVATGHIPSSSTQYSYSGIGGSASIADNHSYTASRYEQSTYGGAQPQGIPQHQQSGEDPGDDGGNENGEQFVQVNSILQPSTSRLESYVPSSLLSSTTTSGGELSQQSRGYASTRLIPNLTRSYPGYPSTVLRVHPTNSPLVSLILSAVTDPNDPEPITSKFKIFSDVFYQVVTALLPSKSKPASNSVTVHSSSGTALGLAFPPQSSQPQPPRGPSTQHPRGSVSTPYNIPTTPMAPQQQTHPIPPSSIRGSSQANPPIGSLVSHRRMSGISRNTLLSQHHGSQTSGSNSSTSNTTTSVGSLTKPSIGSLSSRQGITIPSQTIGSLSANKNIPHKPFQLNPIAAAPSTMSSNHPMTPTSLSPAPSLSQHGPSGGTRSQVHTMGSYVTMVSAKPVSDGSYCVVVQPLILPRKFVDLDENIALEHIHALEDHYQLRLSPHLYNISSGQYHALRSILVHTYAFYQAQEEYFQYTIQQSQQHSNPSQSSPHHAYPPTNHLHTMSGGATLPHEMNANDVRNAPPALIFTHKGLFLSPSAAFSGVGSGGMMSALVTEYVNYWYAAQLTSQFLSPIQIPTTQTATNSNQSQGASEVKAKAADDDHDTVLVDLSLTRADSSRTSTSTQNDAFQSSILTNTFNLEISSASCISTTPMAAAAQLAVTYMKQLRHQNNPLLGTPSLSTFFHPRFGSAGSGPLRTLTDALNSSVSLGGISNTELKYITQLYQEKLTHDAHIRSRYQQQRLKIQKAEVRESKRQEKLEQHRQQVTQQLTLTWINRVIHPLLLSTSYSHLVFQHDAYLKQIKDHDGNHDDHHHSTSKHSDSSKKSSKLKSKSSNDKNKRNTNFITTDQFFASLTTEVLISEIDIYHHDNSEILQRAQRLALSDGIPSKLRRITWAIGLARKQNQFGFLREKIVELLIIKEKIQAQKRLEEQEIQRRQQRLLMMADNSQRNQEIRLLGPQSSLPFHNDHHIGLNDDESILISSASPKDYQNRVLNDEQDQLSSDPPSSVARGDHQHNSTNNDQFDAIIIDNNRYTGIAYREVTSLSDAPLSSATELSSQSQLDYLSIIVDDVALDEQVTPSAYLALNAKANVCRQYYRRYKQHSSQVANKNASTESNSPTSQQRDAGDDSIRAFQLDETEASLVLTPFIIKSFNDIDVDLSRTFPHLAFFRSGSPMKANMRNVLDCYCLMSSTESQDGDKKDNGDDDHDHDETNGFDSPLIVSSSGFYQPQQHTAPLIIRISPKGGGRIVGYVQGLSFLVGKMLLYMDENLTFCSLSSLLTTRFFCSVFSLGANSITIPVELLVHTDPSLTIPIFPAPVSPGGHDDTSSPSTAMAAITTTFDLRYQLLLFMMADLLPDLYQHFTELGMLEFGKSIFFLDWAMTWFGKKCELDLTSRLWDILVFYNESYVYIIAIALLMCMKRRLLQCPLEGIHKALSSQIVLSHSASNSASSPGSGAGAAGTMASGILAATGLSTLVSTITNASNDGDAVDMGSQSTAKGASGASSPKSTAIEIDETQLLNNIRQIRWRKAYQAQLEKIVLLDYEYYYTNTIDYPPLFMQSFQNPSSK